MMQAVSDMARSTPSPSAPLHARGSNQGGVRQYNERVVLQAIRLHGALPKADLARITHLSAQAVSLIIDRLLAEDLVRKQAPLRGGRRQCALHGIRLAGEREGEVAEHSTVDVVDTAVDDFESHAVRGEGREDLSGEPQ